MKKDFKKVIYEIIKTKDFELSLEWMIILQKYTQSTYNQRQNDRSSSLSGMIFKQWNYGENSRITVNIAQKLLE